MLAGIDEAGRGPVLGPLVVAGVACPDPNVLLAMGCTDSKALTPGKREMLDRKIRGHADVRVEVRVIPADVLDDERRRSTLNAIEVERFQDIARALGAPRIIVDAADVDARRFGRQVASGLMDVVVVSEHKADETHVVVGAASIVAKVARDAAIAELGRRLERRLGMPLGSGYASDPLTQAFLREWHTQFGDLPEGTRKSWATIRDLLAPQPTRLDDFSSESAIRQP
ncbi:MAG: ribonuclease HII [Candidatus Thermoplasmatota archaeon]